MSGNARRARIGHAASAFGGAISSLPRLRLSWLVIGAAAVFVSYLTPFMGLAVLTATCVVGILLGGRTPLAVPITFIVTLYMFSPRYTIGSLDITPAVVLAGAALVLAVAGRIAPRREPFERVAPFTLALGGYWAVCLLTYAFGVTSPLHALERARADRSILLLTLMCGVALLVHDTARSYVAVRRVLVGLLVGAMVLAVVACLQAAFHIDLVSVLRPPGFIANDGIAERTLERLDVERAAGTSTHPIEAGTLAAAAIPIALHLAWFGRSLLVRFLGTTGALVLVAGAIATVSRSAFVCLAFVGIVLFLRWRGPRRSALVAGSAAALALVAFALPTFSNAMIALLKSFRGDDIRGARLGARTEDYEVVRDIVGQRPWFGSGYGTFDPSVHFATDNQLLKTIIEVGVIGALALAVLIGVAYHQAGRSRRTAAAAADRDLASTAQIAFLTVALSMLFYDGMSFALALGTFFFLAGVCGALGRLADVRSSTSPHHVRAPAFAAP